MNSQKFQNNKLKTAVLFLVFNKPDTTRQVFEAIRKAKPTRLYIACDGAREGNNKDRQNIIEVKKITSKVDWPCKIKTRFNKKNLGCKYAVSSAISWFFKYEKMGIILEDDCLPSKSFFYFCDDLLAKYKNEHRIMHIAGMTYVEKKNNKENYSYHFCKVGGIWGWASWRRAWKKYELEMKSYKQATQENIFDHIFYGKPQMKDFFKNMFKHAYKNNYTWDYQWTFTKIIHNSINIMPAKNLIKNIGFANKNATHTTNKESKYSDMKINQLNFPLNHPKFIVIDENFNYENFKYVYGVREKLVRVLKLISPKFIIKLIKKIKNEVS